MVTLGFRPFLILYSGLINDTQGTKESQQIKAAADLSHTVTVHRDIEITGHV
jgi:hypothetical protein